MRRTLALVGVLAITSATTLAITLATTACRRERASPVGPEKGQLAPSIDPRIDPREAKVDAIVASALTADGPGVAVAVVVGGRVVVEKGYGLADLSAHTKIDARTNFDLASVSKQLTAMVILRLENQGLLRIDDPVSKHLPALAAFSSLTLADLLHMTSGLAEYTDAEEDFPDPTAVTDDEIVRWAGAQPLQFETGTRFRYTNTNYVALAAVVERVTGGSFADVLHREVLAPVTMGGTVLFDRKDVSIPRRAVGYRKQAGAWKISRDDLPCTGDGNVFSSLDDLIRWDAALRGHTLVSRSTLERAFTSGTLTSGEETGYGFGWFVSKHAGKRLVDHSGAWAGTSTYIARYLDDDVTVILLSNDEDFDTGLAEPIAALFLPR